MALPVDQLAAVPEESARRSALGILSAQDSTRLPELVPVRHDRMGATAFTFYRGAAAVMASDLSLTPDTGIITQLCGDAHLSNFGMFRSPERAMVFDLNDFDETHPGPFEWDVKRLAASMVIATQANGFDDRSAYDIARRTAKRYRKTMIESATKTGLDCWYARIDAEDVVADIGDRFDTATSAFTQKQLKKARHRDSAQALEKLCVVADGHARIRSDPPLLVPAVELMPGMSEREVAGEFLRIYDEYRSSLPRHVVTLLDQYRFVEAARKVVGVGSVGTRCWVSLFAGLGGRDPFFFQIKEAQRSVLADYVPGYEMDNEGRRVVYGQQLLQASSDTFLGWARSSFFDGPSTDFYFRQLRDGKGSVVIEALVEKGLAYYGRLCGRVLAEAHARTGARIDIAAYLEDAGKKFDAAIADFSMEYSRINVGDHADLVDAIDVGAMSAEPLEK